MLTYLLHLYFHTWGGAVSLIIGIPFMFLIGYSGIKWLLEWNRP